MRSNAVECNIFAQTTPKIFSLCPLKKRRAATNGANPAKFTQPRPRRNAKAEPSMHPDTKEIPRKTKRNRELADLPEIPYLCCVFLPTYRLHGILTAPPGFVRAGFCYRRFGVVFFPPYRAARSHTISKFVPSPGTRTCAILPGPSNK